MRFTIECTDSDNCLGYHHVVVDADDNPTVSNCKACGKDADALTTADIDEAMAAALRHQADMGYYERGGL